MVATRFAVAIHILLLLATDPSGQATSARLAASVNTNPVVIRRLAGQLARAGLVRIRRGPGGAQLARDAASITLADVWRAMRQGDQPLLPVHRGPSQDCPVGQAVPALLRDAFTDAETAMEEALARTSIADLAGRLPRQTPSSSRTAAQA